VNCWKPSRKQGNQQPSFVRKSIEGSETIPNGSTIYRLINWKRLASSLARDGWRYSPRRRETDGLSVTRWSRVRSPPSEPWVTVSGDSDAVSQ